MVERLSYTENVGGSIPSGPTKGNMEPQTPAEGISVVYASKRSSMQMYRVDCSCAGSDHSHTLAVETDDDGLITVEIFADATTDYWTNKIENPNYNAAIGFLNSLIRKTKATWGIWTKGQLKYESYIILNEQRALNYAEALKKAVDDAKQRRQEELSKKS